MDSTDVMYMRLAWNANEVEVELDSNIKDLQIETVQAQFGSDVMGLKFEREEGKYVGVQKKDNVFLAPRGGWNSDAVYHVVKPATGKICE